MARLPASRHNLFTAFQKHKACYETLQRQHDRCRRLILFYAVETGLKVYLMDRINKHTFDELLQHHEYHYLNNNGHDIMKMLKSINLLGQFELKTCKCKKDIPVEPHQYHQMWRYGLEIHNHMDEQRAEAELCKIMNYLYPILMNKRLKRS